MAELATERLVDELSRVLRGPSGGEHELLERNPVYAYMVGALYPVEAGEETVESDLDDADDVSSSALSAPVSMSGEALSDDDAGDEGDYDLTGAFGFAPSSMGLSFVHDGRGVRVAVRAGVYTRAEQNSAVASSDEPDRGALQPSRQEAWRREPLLDPSIEIAESHGERIVLGGRAKIAWRTREHQRKSLVTISLSHTETVAARQAKHDPSLCLFQVEMQAEPIAGRILPYPSAPIAAGDLEEQELELRYRNRPVFGVGHGVSVGWDSGHGGPASIRTEAVPTWEVPIVRAAKSSDEALSMAWLAESRSGDELADALLRISEAYGRWIGDQAELHLGLAGARRARAADIVARQRRAQERIEEGVRLLRSDETVRRAFQLANRAMREQMLQQSIAEASPGRLGTVLAQDRGAVVDEPRWRPFQLSFILIALSSTADASHPDRDLVDLIWFPTGGGKTEAYLGLAAFELIRRRLVHGIEGGGTAVVTRYTMRLLTAQQFQRAATLICALERLRQETAELRSTPAFSIGLWIGNNSTPGNYADAEKKVEDLLSQRYPENPFQILACPWCATRLVPEFKSTQARDYGFRASSVSFEVFCPHPECDFNEGLPVQVVDEDLYDNPPSILIATVDKFARLTWIEEGSNLFGLGDVSYLPPTLVIQDELHLISGPLGSVVGVYEAALRALWSWNGPGPKVVASTATVRAASDQVRELMAAEVEVFPPSGIDADDSHFGMPDLSAPGRRYVGLMPQAHTPSYAFGQVSERLLQLPLSIDLSDTERDAYWTLVAYHSSLRELGRSVTILRDDVATRLNAAVQADDGPTPRRLTGDAVEELNGSLDARELAVLLERLAVRGYPDAAGSAIGAIATTNIMSVGIDVTRLGIMLVNGQPKTTAEYIQATSRVGRGEVPGLVVALYRSSKARDRSMFESFRSYHESFYRFVEPSSLTPWSLQARLRSLRAAFVMLMRHGGGLASNEAAHYFSATSPAASHAIEKLLQHVRSADESELEAARRELLDAANEWQEMRERSTRSGKRLRFVSSDEDDRLLRGFTDSGPGWPAMNSMRSVDRSVGIRTGSQR